MRVILCYANNIFTFLTIRTNVRSSFLEKVRYSNFATTRPELSRRCCLGSKSSKNSGPQHGPTWGTENVQVDSKKMRFFFLLFSLFSCAIWPPKVRKKTAKKRRKKNLNFLLSTWTFSVPQVGGQLDST